MALILYLSCSDESAQLRIENVGATPLDRVVVCFPKNEVNFGNVASGATSRFVEVPHGVGPYAAFWFSVDSPPVHQLVMDWSGWKPLPGRAFTYRVRLRPAVKYRYLEVVEVKRER